MDYFYVYIHIYIYIFTVYCEFTESNVTPSDSSMKNAYIKMSCVFKGPSQNSQLLPLFLFSLPTNSPETFHFPFLALLLVKWNWKTAFCDVTIGWRFYSPRIHQSMTTILPSFNLMEGTTKTSVLVERLNQAFFSRKRL